LLGFPEFGISNQNSNILSKGNNKIRSMELLLTQSIHILRLENG